MTVQADAPGNEQSARPSWPMRLWLAMPDWLFRLLGAAVFLGFVALRLPNYFGEKGFWLIGAAYVTADQSIYFPWSQVFIDLTYLLVGLAFCFRVQPKARAARPGEIIIPIIAAFWPFLPWAAQAILQGSGSPLASRYGAFMMDRRAWGPLQFLAGSMVILLGNMLDVWGYAVLFRSVSIVAEARVLKVNGPYRFVRHPIYMGQILAQAGVWLFYAQTHLVWIAFYACFVAMQLYRARVEEVVLERAFGEQYAKWKRETYWFW
jgi:protein-S-isoprenylcysteine O-methyltransferase Ste14